MRKLIKPWAEHLSDAPSTVFDTFNAMDAEIRELRAALAALEAEFKDLESDLDTCMQHNVELQTERAALAAQEPVAVFDVMVNDALLAAYLTRPYNMKTPLKSGDNLYAAAGAAPVPIPFVTVNACGSHHYTAENVLSLVRYLRACEDGTEVIKWEDKDHKTFAGVLWRVIQALSHDVPYSAAPAPEGWQLVPVEPTPEMMDQGAQAIVSWENGSTWPDSWGKLAANQHRKDCRKAYTAMLAAAPQEPS